MARIRTLPESAWYSAARRPDGDYHIYIIQEGTDGPVKVGRARNAFWRRTDLQSGNHRKLHVRHVFGCDHRELAKEIEATVKVAFAEARLLGEWYAMAPGVVANFILEWANGA